ncbi:hypothetical protein PG994_005264 [Apiospora phragmitis]|uniref:Fungal N-terminal domain-containing protein n=1 Tax=Apiospora phragmitis TaxID=2905665 RepID=A0ABR1VSZ2_9PEZI
MDPLSITTSVITLLDASSKVYQFLQSIRHADTHYAALSNELSTLTGLLRSIRVIFQDCRRHPFALIAIDGTVWDQSRIAITDCQQTINDLDALVKRIGGVARSNSIFRKARMTTQMHAHSGEARSFRDKIHVSTVSLHTLLQIITVSLSLRSNTSHDLTLHELRRLKQDLETSGRAPRDFDSYATDRSDRHLSRNLESLLRAARDFHSNASNTASTVYGGGTSDRNTDSCMGQVYTDSISVPRITSVKRRHMESFLKRQAPPSLSDSWAPPIAIGAIPASPRSFISSRLEPHEDATVKIDVEIDNLVSGGLRKTAQKAIRQLDFKKAAAILERALERYKIIGPEDTYHSRLRTQIVLCSILQGLPSSDLEDSIIDLAEYRGTKQTVAVQLLYALALSYMHTLDFKKALRICSLIESNSIMGSNHYECPGKNEVLKLFLVSYRLSGNDIDADAIEELIPQLSSQETLPTPCAFLSGCPELMGELFDTSGYFEILRYAHQIRYLYASARGSSLELRLAQTGNGSNEDTEYHSTRSQSTLRRSGWMGARSRKVFSLLKEWRHPAVRKDAYECTQQDVNYDVNYVNNYVVSYDRIQARYFALGLPRTVVGSRRTEAQIRRDTGNAYIVITRDN